MEELYRWVMVCSSSVSHLGEIRHTARHGADFNESEQNGSLQVPVQYLKPIHEQEETDTLYNIHVN